MTYPANVQDSDDGGEALHDSLAASAVTHAQSHDFICLHHAT